MYIVKFLYNEKEGKLFFPIKEKGKNNKIEWLKNKTLNDINVELDDVQKASDIKNYFLALKLYKKALSNKLDDFIEEEHKPIESWFYLYNALSEIYFKFSLTVHPDYKKEVK